MLRHQFQLWDEDTYESMQNFPLHYFDTSPVIYLPISSSTSEQFLVAIQADGVIFSVSPNLHKIQSRKELNDADEHCIVALSTVHKAELCVVVWDSTAQFYFAHFLKAEHYEFRVLGKAKLSAPDPALFLCGAAHLGSLLFIVWSDGTVQYYKSSNGEGMILVEAFKLTGLDFGAMGRTVKTEDLRSLSYGVSVCSTLNSDGIVCILGPEFETTKIKYILLDTRSSLIQESRVLDHSITVKAPLKMSPVVSKKGSFCLYLGETDFGEKTVKISPSTLATRVGIHHPSRKRKLNEEENNISLTKANQRESVILSQPTWIEYVSSSQSGSSNPLKISKKANLVQKGKECGSLMDQDLHVKVAGLMERLKSSIHASYHDPGLFEDALDVLQLQKSNGAILLVDFAGHVAEYIASVTKNWTHLHQMLELINLSTLESCPSLPGALLDAFEYGFFTQVMSNQQEMGTELLTSLLHRLFGKVTNPVEVIEQARMLSRMKTKLESEIAILEQTIGNKTDGVQIGALKWKILAFDGFNCSEILLHSLISQPLSQSSFQLIMRALDRQEIKQLMVYLSKWFKILLKEYSVPEKVTGMEVVCRIPVFQRVLDWLSTVLSFHMNVILAEEDLHSILTEIDELLKDFKTKTDEKGTNIELPSVCL
eukprot:g2142.t1